MSKTKPSIILVHGSWADGTSWQHVIPLLIQAGYNVTAVQNPLISLPDDIAITKRVIDAQPEPVVAVGHSYGGAAITGAAVGSPHVKALVYIAGWALAPGDSISQLIGKYPPPPLVTAIVPDAGGFLYIDREKFHEVFAHDVSPAEAQVLAVAQKPAASITFEQSVESAAWQTIPSWYLLAQEDRAINPELQRFMASRIGAKITELQASHVSYISRSREVTNLILEAASSAVE
ncbi:alpha/beta hydrolase [Chroococcidiopsis sp. FACHB-1243]|uniref:alpha/beta fold hydrolase n=1 Tax=Chroococcidiopsis sp. [FACHB-1243] TaxID=2692781 RepID=UPI00177B6605|nr:alpha/beta hydrolase [Chroococcidiopsis sp. [FACHB-1243]]MBD2309584.1 alpha/beta hydrolase [Chroococcidiopsis sp. [FACHB-1243]]